MHKSRHFTLVSIAIFLAFGCQGPGNAEDAVHGRAPAEDALIQAQQDPYDPARFAAYAATLPKHGDRYVVDGDLLLTDLQLRTHLANAKSASAPANPDELIVDKVDGRWNIWDKSNRKITYSIDRASFGSGEADVVQTNLAKASKDLMGACPSCGLSFRLDDSSQVPRKKPAHFVVRKVNAGYFIAAAFFPSDAASRMVLEIDASYFTTDFDPVGVLRHELGHVLGYRHEHIEGVKGCIQEGGTWQRVSTYTPKSFMHYMCGGKGSRTLALTERDKQGHRDVYGK